MVSYKEPKAYPPAQKRRKLHCSKQVNEQSLLSQQEDSFFVYKTLFLELRGSAARSVVEYIILHVGVSFCLIAPCNSLAKRLKQGTGMKTLPRANSLNATGPWDEFAGRS